jgi:hypothetical protein
MAPLNPEIQVQIITPDFEIITPEALPSLPQEFLSNSTGALVAKISPILVVKYGEYVKMNEASACNFVRRHTSIIMPRAYAAYTYGPFEGRNEEWHSQYDIYILMDFVEGQTLEKEWDHLDDVWKSRAMEELQDYLEQLRSIPEGYVYWIQ